MSTQEGKEPGRAWLVVFAGVAVNLCLGMLYAWSVWKKALVDKGKADAGEIMPPKSTWFEPKLLSGLVVHTFN